MAASMLPQGVSVVKIPDPIKSGISTAAFTFVVMFLLGIGGSLTSLAQWASSSGATPLPSISAIGYAAVGAATAAITGLVATIVRWAQGKFAWVPGKPPQFQGGKP